MTSRRLFFPTYCKSILQIPLYMAKNHYSTIIPETWKDIEGFCTKVSSHNVPCIFLEWTQKKQLKESTSLSLFQNFDKLIIYDCINDATLFIPSMDKLICNSNIIDPLNLKRKKALPNEQEQMASLYRLLRHGNIMKFVWCEFDDKHRESLLHLAIKPYLNINLLLGIASINNHIDIHTIEKLFIEAFRQRISQFFDIVRNEHSELWKLSENDQERFDRFYS